MVPRDLTIFIFHGTKTMGNELNSKDEKILVAKEAFI